MSSANKALCAQYYNNGTGSWTISMLAAACAKGKITAAEFEEITGHAYGEYIPASETLEDYKAAKIATLSTTCNAKIIAGADIALSEGKVQHFDYGTEDQLNISEMFNAIVMGATCYPYQPKNGSCTVYQAADIVTIYITLAAQKTAQLTYYHALKDFVQTLSTIAEINAVTYGQPLTGEYLTHYNATIAVASEQMQAVIAHIGSAS